MQQQHFLPDAPEKVPCPVIVVTTSGGGQSEEKPEGFWHWSWIAFLWMFQLLLLLGCLKALLGVVYSKVGKWRYDYVQPGKRYDQSSSFRRFLINLVFFVVYPCVCCCRCFEEHVIDGADAESEDDGGPETDRQLHRQGLLKGTTVIQRQVQLTTTTITTTTGSSSSNSDPEELEGWISSGPEQNRIRAKPVPYRDESRRVEMEQQRSSGQTDDDDLSRLLLDIKSSSEEIDPDPGQGKRKGMGMGSGRGSPYRNIEDEEHDTKFVLTAMDRSRKSLRTAQPPRAP
ncbi:uncharacterized protein LOC129740464 isoform X2 [Uranotaenia lowii]|uniref:uncharacterized protein LOC129740464 isoform X2 n=1 Tax=Uranotaenia lowii TaxID=190385 RepID=UPI00247860C1|nr:uncharacterized protein LOC129740464 isoform X2 [Uranotaenia lowii]